MSNPTQMPWSLDQREGGIGGLDLGTTIGSVAAHAIHLRTFAVRARTIEPVRYRSCPGVFAAAHCLDDVNEPEDEILYGTAGYL